jgi:DNA-binding CsgD family transcriptional regulator
MIQDRQLPISDIRALLRLANSLHGAPDPISRKRQMLAGLCELTAAACGAMLVTQREPKSGRQRLISLVEHWPERQAEVLNIPTRLLPAGKVSESSEVYTARSLLEPMSPHRLFRHIAPGTCLEHVEGPRLACTRQLGETRGIATIHLLRRGKKRTPFSHRHRLLVNLFHKNTCWVYEPDLVLLSPNAHALSPRERETLEYLLAGKSEKEIAMLMQVSRNTVHHYVKSLHKHFGVSSRSELLARWVGK